jgi:hypothetical protein
MPRTAEEVIERLQELTKPGFREKLIARGLARGLIWEDGKLPAGAPIFSKELSTDLLDHGFGVLALSLELRQVGGPVEVVKQGLYTAAEAIESAVRRGSAADIERGFHLTMTAAAFHIGGYAARAFSLFETDLPSLNLASYELALVLLMRRNFVSMRQNSAEWLQATANSDAGVVERLTKEDDFSIDDVVAIALTRIFHRAIAVFEVALLTGRAQYFEIARNRIEMGLTEAAAANHVPLWWSFTIARHLFDDLWGTSLHVCLPLEGGPPAWPTLRADFLQVLAARPVAEIDLWPSQIEAARRVLDTSDDLVVALPTSAGKTRIAELCILRTLADGKRVIYVTPLRALSAQVESGLARTFRPLGVTVTSVYGASGVASSDIDTLASASIVVATPEKLDFAIRQEPSLINDVGLIVLDEGHMIGLSERDIRYEMLLQRLLRREDAAERRLVCLSAVFSKGDSFDDFTAWLRSDVPGTAIQSRWRPTRQRPATVEWQKTVARLELDVEGEKPFVPRFVEAQLPFKPRRKLFPSDAQELVVASTSAFLARGQSVLIYCPQKVSVETTAGAFLKANKGGYFQSALTASARAKLANAIRIGKEWLGESHPAVASLYLGIAVHHGSLPRSFLSEVESLLKQRLLPICVCSATLAQGVDLSFSVLLFRSLYRAGKIIPAKEFANVVGRVGRAFVDLDGIYALPIYEATPAKALAKKAVFNRLIVAAQRRQLESGVRLLIDVIIRILRERLNVSAEQIVEYVTNMQSPWAVQAINEDDNYPGALRACLNELDTAILGVVDVLELPMSEVADYLDQCLQGSYWQRRLQRTDKESKHLQEAVIRGRAAWIWSHSDAEKRKGYFAAGVGYAAGKALDDNADELRRLLTSADQALAAADVATAVSASIDLAKIIFAIHPFEPDNAQSNWPKLLDGWLRGRALAEFADNVGVGFIQGDVVYRLVWGVEAARLHIAQTRSAADDGERGSDLALCLTYGVPNRGAALFIQGGMNSRTLACKVAQGATGTSSLREFAELKEWVYSILRGEVPEPTWESADEKAEWERFLQKFDHREHGDWERQIFDLPVRWYGMPIKAGSRVRVSCQRGERTASVLSVSLDPLGETVVPDVATTHFFGIVREDQKSLEVSFFGR